MKTSLFASAAVTLFALSPSGFSAVLFSTGWDNPTSTATDTVSIYNSTLPGYAANTIAITGAGTNAPSPANFWTVTNSAQVDLSSVSYITNGGNTAIGATSGNDRLFKGSVFTSAQDFTLNAGANTAQIRYATNTGVWAPQFNTAGVNNGRFNVLFEIKPGTTLDGWSVSLNYGTAGTNGAWNNNTAAQNGTVDIDIYSVAGDGTLSLTGITFTGVSLSGAGPLATLNADNSASSLGAGNYLLSISLTGKTLNQRYTIDNLSVSAVPEPTAALLAAIGLTAVLTLRRRARD